MAHIIIALDSSGSMKRNSRRVIDGFNEFVQTQQRTVDNSTLTLITFSDTIETVFENKPLNEVKSIDENDYKTNGMTALHDALGQALTRYAGDHRTLLVIITDGEENASSHFDAQAVESLVQIRTEEGWKIIYLCTDLHTAKSGDSIGLRSATRGSHNPSTQNLMTPPESLGPVLCRQVSYAASQYRQTNEIHSIDELNSGVSELDLNDPLAPPPLRRY